MNGTGVLAEMIQAGILAVDSLFLLLWILLINSICEQVPASEPYGTQPATYDYFLLSTDFIPGPEPKLWKVQYQSMIARHQLPLCK